jgi:hypothetical protein
VSLRTCREDVDKETAGNDGILNNLVCLTGELHILDDMSGVCQINGQNPEANGEVKPLIPTSELGEVILIPYVFSMMFLPSAL